MVSRLCMADFGVRPDVFRLYMAVGFYNKQLRG